MLKCIFEKAKELHAYLVREEHSAEYKILVPRRGFRADEMDVVGGIQRSKMVSICTGIGVAVESGTRDVLVKATVIM